MELVVKFDFQWAGRHPAHQRTDGSDDDDDDDDEPMVIDGDTEINESESDTPSETTKDELGK